MAISRRTALRLLLGTGTATVGSAVAGAAWFNQKYSPHTPLHHPFPARAGVMRDLPATPACHDEDLKPTRSVTEGPFYRPGSPERTVLRDAQTVGRPLVIEGRVLSTNCQPIAGAILEFWSCDGQGVYDNEGYRLRGHQFTDADGRFRVETVKPADYKQFGIHRTPHVHVKVQGHETALLTTQLFFPDEPLNARDWFFNERLLVKMGDPRDASLAGSFNFILARA